LPIAVDPAGNVFVADRDNNRIQKLTREIGVDGDHLVTWGTLGSGDGYFNKPAGIAVDGAGNVYVADTLNNRMSRSSTMTAGSSSGGAG
jgi:tripartite motif-containing protein 71